MHSKNKFFDFFMKLFHNLKTLSIMRKTKIGNFVADYLVLHANDIKSILCILAMTCLVILPECIYSFFYDFRDNFFNCYFQILRIYLAIIAPVFFLPGKIGKIFFSLCISFLSVSSMIILILFYKYRLEISGDCFLLIFNSNAAETKEFLISLLSLHNILVAIISIAFAVCCILKFSKMRWSFTILHIITGILIVLPLSVTYVRYTIKKKPALKIFKPSSLSRFISEYDIFQKQYGIIIKNLTKAPVLPEGLKREQVNIAGIIVIGESAYRKHHSIYGYARNTTPNLLRRQDSILAFNNVISATVQTPTAIRYLLTDETLNTQGEMNYSLPDLLKAVGYKTSWISNHYAWGLAGYESSTALLAQKCDKHYFIHEHQPGEKYDIACLVPAEKMLDSSQPVILFVHIQGSHIGYSERYPKNFGSFKDSADIAAKTLKSNLQTTNEYDCSIEYTDFVLEKLINLLEKQNRPSFMLYVGDHSECNGLDSFTIARATNSTVRACYEIPFLVWFSNQYKERFPDLIKNGRKNLQAPLQGDLAIWTIAELCGLSWKDFPVKNSLFSPYYPKKVYRRMYNKPY